VATLNPSQQRALDLMARPARPATPLEPGLAVALQDELERRLADVVEELAGERLHVNKHALATVHTCERHYLVTEHTFSWTVRTARGTVAHKAIQLAVNWRGEPEAATLVDEAMALLMDADASVSAWLGGLPEATRAELRSEAVDLVTAFLECFPPLQKEWRPVTESAVRVDVFGGLVRLHGRVDLTLGRADAVPRKVIIDLKTGLPAATHRDDLRFYALMETIRLGVPPRLLATYYLDAARLEPEEVDTAVLESALTRTAEGVRKIVEITRMRRAAMVSPGPSCGWCVAQGDCSEGRAYWRERTEGDR
jgi:hypothetical protein